MGKLGLNSGYIGSDQRTTTSGVVGYDKYYLERRNGRFNPVLEVTYLLDTYSGASAAYSLRKLSSIYGGSAIRVRRSSDNVEQDIGFSGVELNTSELLSFCGVGNGFVTTWYDQSGNGRNATQTTAGNQPQIVSSGNLITENSKPTLQFDGINDVLTSATISSVFSNSSMFTVLKIANQTGEDVPFGYGAANQSSAIRVLYSSTGKKLGFATWSNDYVSSIDTISTSLYLLSVVQNSNNISLRKNTTTNTGNLPSIPSSTLTSAYSIGGITGNTSYNTEMYGSEFIFYPSDQSLNRTLIETNINAYYSVY